MKHLFVIDPIDQIQPQKDSSAALMEPAYRASIEIWVCTPADLQAKGAKARVAAKQVIPEPWINIGEPLDLDLNEFNCILMNKYNFRILGGKGKKLRYKSSTANLTLKH